jgi:hypothetical protein
MLGSGHRRACALVVVLALLSGMTTAGLPAPQGCKVCAPTCPMHAHRLGCHHAGTPPCHTAGRVGVVRGTCGHEAPAVDAPSLRATLTPLLSTRLLFAVHRLAPAAVPRLTAPLREPPTDPPRVFPVPV